MPFLNALFEFPGRVLDAYAGIVREQVKLIGQTGRCGICGDSVSKDEDRCRECEDASAW